MSNGAECCAIGVCCPPASEGQRVAAAAIVARDAGCSPVDARRMVDALLVHVAFAPKSFEPLLAEILAKAANHGA